MIPRRLWVAAALALPASLAVTAEVAAPANFAAVAAAPTEIAAGVAVPAKIAAEAAALTEIAAVAAAPAKIAAEVAAPTSSAGPAAGGAAPLAAYHDLRRYGAGFRAPWQAQPTFRAPWARAEAHDAPPSRGFARPGHFTDPSLRGRFDSPWREGRGWGRWQVLATHRDDRRGPETRWRRECSDPMTRGGGES